MLLDASHSPQTHWFPVSEATEVPFRLAGVAQVAGKVGSSLTLR